MAVLIDPPAWPAHGRRWSHLVSDVSLAELHAFAERLGVPARGFEGDHYDVPEERYAAAVAAGALPVTSRELLLRLRASGLRRPKRRGEKVVASRPDGDGFRLDTVHSAMVPAGSVTGRVVVVEAAGRLLILPDGAGFLLPPAAWLGRVLPTAVADPITRVGYLRRVPASGPWTVEEVVHRRLAEPPTAPDPARWEDAGRAVPLLPGGLVPLVRIALRPEPD